MKLFLTLTFIVFPYCATIGVAQSRLKVRSQKTSIQKTKAENLDFQKLTDLISQADKIVVYDYRMETERILFTSSDPKDIADFKESISIAAPDAWVRCSCMSMPTVRLYRDDKELAVITYFSPRLIRASIWKSDAFLHDTEKWLKWFDDRKIPWLRKEYEADLARAKKQELAEVRWQKAMPKSIRPLWASVTKNQFFSGILAPDLSPLKKALIKELPATSERILALSHWFGSGAGPWSGFPAYETIPETLLLEYHLSDILSVVKSTTITDAQLEGLARLLAGWDFSQKRPKDVENIPEAIKKILLAHSLKSTIEDNRDRAKSAFEH